MNLSSYLFVSCLSFSRAYFQSNLTEKVEVRLKYKEKESTHPVTV